MKQWYSIRRQLLITMLSLVIALLATLTYMHIRSQQAFLAKELAYRETLMREKTIQRGQSLSDNLAHQVAIELAVFNLSKIYELMHTAVKDEQELAYCLLLDAERMVYFHTQQPELEYETLSTKEAIFAVAQEQQTQQTLERNGEEIVEFIAPIKISIEQWGVLRLGFSMAKVTAEIAHSRQETEEQIRGMVITSVITAMIFLLFGFIIVFMISTKISKPLIELTHSARELANGNFSTQIHVQIGYQNEVSVLAIAFADMAKNLEFSYKQLEQYNKAYERFVPSQFLSLLAKQSVLDINLGDQVEREMTVLFSDIRDFTALSETMKPQENFDFINAYLSRMEPIVGKHHGLIDKYIGDAIMALFPTNADDAVRGSIAMLKVLFEYNQERQQAGLLPIYIGIGLNTGPLMLGTIGSETRMDSTVISDAVNLASRVEGLTKIYGTALLITEQTHLKLADPLEYHIRVIDVVKVKGKSEEVTIYEVYDADSPATMALKEQTRDDFEEGFVLYHWEEFNDARPFFERVLQVNKNDKAAQFYLKRCKYFQKYGVPYDGNDCLK